MAHLLLIDDDPALIPGQVRQAFPAPAYRVEVAGTGAGGLERVRAMLPDVILLDLRLPDRSGLEVYQQIRRIGARIPVIFVTVAKTPDAAIESMRHGAYDYLFKPLDPHQLQRVVGDGLEVARRMRQPAVFAETALDPHVAAPSSAAVPPCARSTRPSAGSLPSCSRPSCTTSWETSAEQPYPPSCRGRTSASRPGSASNCGLVIATCTLKRTINLTGSCCPSSSSTHRRINSRRPACLGSPGKPCA